ncbi:MAG: hydantoinase/oxoprolinase family protein [Pseudomonadota bacterium]
MARLLGIDTGGTYTDAVVLDEDAIGTGILAKAKALTTKQDLSIGISGAVDAVLAEGIAPGDIALVSISTTLATNALVEGHGGRVCLILIGFDDAALDRGGLSDAIGSDPVYFVAGGHTATGDRQAPLDREAVLTALRETSGTVQGYAVVAHFGTRDPVDETTVRDIILEQTNVPVTCGHELASALGGPKRAVTAVLNARLIGMISDLIAAVRQITLTHGITAPIMIVRGDGSLVSAEFARARPIETILSGPAASLVGAAYLTHSRDAVVSDIGGTTTDIAVLRDGRPSLSPGGAKVGQHQTMVEAIDMVTHGLGGDSEVRVDDTHRAEGVLSGPQRAIPISLLALQFPGVIGVLREQLSRVLSSTTDARFLIRNPAVRPSDLKDGEQKVYEAVPETPVPVSQVIRTRMQASAVQRLVRRGLLRVSAFTPSDAAHVLGTLDAWNREAADLAARLMARQSTARGQAVAASPTAFAEMVRASLIRRSAEVLFDAAVSSDGVEQSDPSMTALAKASFAGHSGAARISLGLALPLVGLGASASAYYPDIAAMLGTKSVVPEDADVANAVGAVVGRVRLIREVTVTQPSDGRFQIHLAEAPESAATVSEARERAMTSLRAVIVEQARRAGATEIEVDVDWIETTAEIEGQIRFIEGQAVATAIGRPRLAG